MPDQSQKSAKSGQITALDPPKQSVGAKFKVNILFLFFWIVCMNSFSVPNIRSGIHGIYDSSMWPYEMI